MRYSDLVQQTQALPEGRHAIYALDGSLVQMANLGVRHEHLSPVPEFRLYLYTDGRETCPRHSDLLSDFLLKTETRPDLRLPLSEACEHVCSGADPREQFSHRRLPVAFSVFNDNSWTMQTSAYQTGGLPTEIFLCGLQVLIRVCELNASVPHAAEAFRQAFLALENGAPLLEVAQKLKPQFMPAKRYFDRRKR